MNHLFVSANNLDPTASPLYAHPALPLSRSLRNLNLCRSCPSKMGDMRMDEKELRERIDNLTKAIQQQALPSTVVPMLQALKKPDAPTADNLRVSLWVG